jgi:hypothetical protein
MMRYYYPIAPILRLAFADLIRQRTLHLVLLFAMLILGSTPLFVELSFAEQLKFIKDFCWGAMVIFNVAIAILGASHLLWSDIENRSLLTILAKPVARWQVIVGKFLGLALMLALTTVFMTIGSLALSEWKKSELILQEQRLAGNIPSPELEAIKKQNIPILFWQAALLVWCKALMMAAVTFLLTTIASSPMFSVLCGTLIYIIGHLQGVAREAWESGGGWQGVVLMPFVFLVPDFKAFAALEEVGIQSAMPWGYVGSVLGYAGLYSAGALAVGMVIFNRRPL